MNFGLQSLVSDISVSMFKVAAVMGHPCLKSELETLAVSIAIDPCPENIFSAENLINLGREVGEIKPLNAVVLIRELESLRKGLSTAPVNSQAGDVDISQKFTRKNVDTISTSSTHSSSAASTVAANKDVQVASDTRTANSHTPKKTRTSPGRKSSLNSDKVYQYIVDHKEARLKELEAAFNEVSGRTVRRMTDTLIKEGKIERVGNPGPTSFYRLSSANTSPREVPQERSGADSPRFYADNDIPEGSPEAASLSEDAPQFSYGESDGYSDVIAL
jgi:hypothetical protein